MWFLMAGSTTWEVQTASNWKDGLFFERLSKASSLSATLARRMPEPFESFSKK